MVRKQYPLLELANQMPVRICIWPGPSSQGVRRALGTRMGQEFLLWQSGGALFWTQTFHVLFTSYIEILRFRMGNEVRRLN
jgi:hypothetical protein